jgi:hypothetical protein
MTRLTLLAAAVLALPGVAAPARAADRALVADVDKDLAVSGDKYDERAVLAAVLARPAESAAFDAQARAALSDPKTRALFVQAWRAKLAAFADEESKRPDLDQTRVYRNWGEMMSPEQRAYTEARMLTISAENRDKLVYYLKKLNEDLASNGGHIDQGFFSVAKRIVSGVMDQYRADLVAYAQSPQAADGRRNGASAAQQLAQLLAQPAAAPQSAVPQSVASPAPLPAPAKAPPKPVGPPLSAATNSAVPPVLGPSAIPTNGAGPNGVGTASGALAQAQAAERAGQNGGAVLDGGTARGPADVVVGGPNPGGPAATLAPSTGGPQSGLTASAPPSPGGSDDFMNRVEGMGSGQKPSFGNVALIGAGLLAVIGGLIGFLVAGPVGAAIGAALGGGGGYFGSKALLSKYT